MSDREQESQSIKTLFRTLWSIRKFRHNIKIYALARDYTKHEDILINNRLTWILTIHGFLYATYGLTVQKNLEIAAKIASDTYGITDAAVFARYMDRAALCPSIWKMHIFLIFISMIGIFISIFGARSIKAAYSAAENVRDIIEDIFPPIECRSGSKIYKLNIGDSNIGPVMLPDITGGGSYFLTRKGHSGGRIIPWVLFGGWVVAIIFEASYLWINVNKLCH